MRAVLAAIALAAAPAAAAAVLPAGATAVDPPAAPGAGSLRLASSPDGVLATWIESAGDGGRVRFARFAGERWSPPATVAESRQLFANWADTPGAAAAGDGGLVAWWLERTGTDPYAYSIALAHSSDGGARWARLGWLADDRAPAEHGFVSMVAEGSGWRAFWLDGRATLAGGPMALRTATITGGASPRVGPSTVVDDAVCDCCPTAAIAAAGSTLLAWRDRSREEVRDVRVARWEGRAAVAVPLAGDGWKLAGCPVNGPALAGAAQHVALVWFTAPGDSPRVAAALSADGGRTFSAAVVVDGNRPVGRVGAAALADGDFALSWLARAERGGEVRLRRLGRSARLGRPLALAATGAGREAGIPQLAATSDGRLLAAWVETDDGAARLRAAVVTASALPSP